ncbi:MAG: DUF4263 domain-containing protein [Oscillospiraceae bacterium]|nr:DUF4263 domain-containing protein [Oscillospiraceae bacterium]
MNNEQLIKKIGTLSESDFQTFCQKMLFCTYGKELKPCQSTSMALYARVPTNLISPVNEAQVFLLEYLPYELFSDPNLIPFDNPITRKKLKSIVSEFAEKQMTYQIGPRFISDVGICGWYFFTHILGPSREFFVDIAYHQYEKMIDSLGFGKRAFILDRDVGIGSPYSYVENEPQDVINALDQMEKTHTQLSIEYSDGRYEVNQIRQGKYVSAGVGQISGDIFYSQLVTRDPNYIIQEFQNLLNSNPSERLLSEFIIEHYQHIFGYKYDAIQSEVCLSFPELDIAEKKRRIDIMIHNSAINDWELIELKKKIRLSSTYRGVPVFSHEISGAIEQLRNYYDILQQQPVRDHFRREGIEYYNPVLKLVVGGSQNASHEQWRKMLSSSRGVHVITYDELIKEMKANYL